MKDKRQGNDLKVAWSIFMQDGEPFRLEGKDVSLYLKNMFGRKELNDFVTTGNIIQWTFYGKDQKNTGKYSLELVINEGEKGMITTDKCDFVNLVSCSCKLQGGEDAPNVETESIELTSTLEYVSGGGSYDDTALWKELAKKVDKEENKGLSSNDFTNALKEKLESLENYDDAEISSAVEKLSRDFNALLGNNASAAIESFNEIIAFLEGIEDSASLDAIVASIQQEIAKVSNGLADTDVKLTELSAEVSGLSEGLALRNVGAADTDESVEEPEIPTEKDYELLLDVTMEEDVERFNASAVAPRLLECKDFIVFIEFLYDENKKNRSGYILFKNGSQYPSARIESVVTANYLTHYALRIHLGQGVDKTASIESHTNAWGNPQYGTPKGNIMGINLSTAPWDIFDFQFGFFANEKIMIYGK